MIELGELEAHHSEFAQRNTRVVVASVEGREAAEKTQHDFPHLTVVSDQERNLANTVKLIHPRSAPDGGDTAAPTVILIDRRGIVRWLFRPQSILVRLTPAEKLAALDEHLPAERD